MTSLAGMPVVLSRPRQVSTSTPVAWTTDLSETAGTWTATATRPGLRLVAHAETPDDAARALVALVGVPPRRR